MFFYTTFITIVKNVVYLFSFPRVFILVISCLWLVVLIKKLFFWVWLWQLKEYHSGRFLSHFDTYKGKKLIFNYLNLVKLLLVVGAIFAPVYFFPTVLFIYFLLIVYFGEAILAIFRLIKKDFRYPVLTSKTILILGAGILVLSGALLMYRGMTSIKFIFSLLIFDLLSPIIFSILVFCFLPITFIWQKRLIKKAINKREQFKDLIVIGITGSYGKTSTKEFLYTILASKYGEGRVLKTKANQNSEVGISQCILNDLKPEHKIFVCEMGAYNCGGIKLLCDIAQPKIGILTGINEQHMATFGSQENIISTKLELIRSLPEGGLAILNESNQKIKNEKLKIKNYNSKLKNIKYCSTEQVTDLEVRKESISFNLEGIDFNLNLVGAQNVINLLMAVCCDRELGMNLKEIALACGKIKPFRKTMELKKGREGITIIDDSYSANPAGVFAAIDYLKLYSGQKIIIMPCLIELGKAGKRIHQEIGERIGKICDLAIITTRDYFKEIKGGAIGAGMKKEGILFLGNPQEILGKVKPHLQTENVILLESRISEKLAYLLMKN